MKGPNRRTKDIFFSFTEATAGQAVPSAPPTVDPKVPLPDERRDALKQLLQTLMRCRPAWTMHSLLLVACKLDPTLDGEVMQRHVRTLLSTAAYYVRNG